MARQTHPVLVRLGAEDYDRLKSVAERERRPPSVQALLLLEQALRVSSQVGAADRVASGKA